VHTAIGCPGALSNTCHELRKLVAKSIKTSRVGGGGAEGCGTIDDLVEGIKDVDDDVD